MLTPPACTTCRLSKMTKNDNLAVINDVQIDKNDQK